MNFKGESLLSQTIGVLDFSGSPLAKDYWAKFDNR